MLHDDFLENVDFFVLFANVDYYRKDMDETTSYNIFENIRKYEPPKSAFML